MRKLWSVLVTIAFSLPLSFLIFPVAPSNAASQVIRDEMRQWARQAVQNEAALNFKAAPNTVAVLYFQNQSRQPRFDFLQKGLAVMLMADLTKIKEIQVVERTQIEALIQELRLGASGLVLKETAPRMGRLLGARYLVGGRIKSATQEAITVDSDLLNVPQNGIVGSLSSQGTLETLLEMEKQFLFKIVELLHLDLTTAQKARLRQPITTHIKALMYLVQGIDASDTGDYEKAAEYYQKALTSDPNLAPAGSALDELRDLGLIAPLPDTQALLRNLHQRVSVNRGPIPDQMTKRRYWEPASVLGPAGAATADVQVQW